MSPRLSVDEIWYKLKPIERIASALNVPILFLSMALFFYVLKNFGYREILLVWTFTLFINFLIHDFADFQIYQRQNEWPTKLSNYLFRTIFWIILFDIIYQFGLFDSLSKVILSNWKSNTIDKNFIILLIIIFFIYFISYILTSGIHTSIIKLLPDFKEFYISKKLRKIILNFVSLTIYVSIIFAAVHYLTYVSLGFKGFSKTNLNFLDITFFSFSVFFSSPISDIKPTNIFTRLLVGFESIISFLLLVIFIAFLLNKYLSGQYRQRRKGKRINKNISVLKRFIIH